MTLAERLKTVPAGMWLMLNNATVIHSLMIGITQAGISSAGEVVVEYEDGTFKSGQADERFLANDETSLTLLTFASFFSP